MMSTFRCVAAEVAGSPCQLQWDRGDLCPRYTDCQQLRDECRPAIMYMVQYCLPVVLYTILYYYTTTIMYYQY